MFVKTTAPRTLLLAAGATLVLLASESAMQPQRAAAAGAPVCETLPKPEELRPLLSAARREQFAKDILQVISAELDGAAPREAVAFADHAPSEEDTPLPETDEEADALRDAPRRESVVWVFRCMNTRWQQVAERSYGLNQSRDDDSGKYGSPGFKRVKAERLLADRDLLRVEWLNARASPFSVFRSFDLYALRSNELDPVFGCATLDTAYIGPERWGRSTEHTIQFLNDQLPARIRVALRSARAPGVLRGEPPHDGLPAQESRTEIYRYDGTKFVTQRPACDERFEDNWAADFQGNWSR